MSTNFMVPEPRGKTNVWIGEESYMSNTKGCPNIKDELYILILIVYIIDGYTRQASESLILIIFAIICEMTKFYFIQYNYKNAFVDDNEILDVWQSGRNSYFMLHLKNCPMRNTNGACNPNWDSPDHSSSDDAGDNTSPLRNTNGACNPNRDSSDHSSSDDAGDNTSPLRNTNGACDSSQDSSDHLSSDEVTADKNEKVEIFEKSTTELSHKDEEHKPNTDDKPSIQSCPSEEPSQDISNRSKNELKLSLSGETALGEKESSFKNYDSLLPVNKNEVGVTKSSRNSECKFNDIMTRCQIIEKIVKEEISRSNSTSFGLKFVSDSLANPSQYVSYISRPTETQVYNAVEAIPHRVNGIPWKFLYNERYRLMSFVKFPSKSRVSTIKLASKGFAYLESDAEIICYFCFSLFKIENDEDHIDEEHKRLGVDCPMVKGTRCNNISMEHQRPNMNVEEIFSLLESKKDEVENEEQSPESSSSRPTMSRPVNRSHQPSDEGASSAIITNTSDLAEVDSALLNPSQTPQSSQIMDDSPSTEDRPQSVVSAHTSTAVEFSTAGNDNNNTTQSGSVVSSSNGQQANNSQQQQQANNTQQQANNSQQQANNTQQQANNSQQQANNTQQQANNTQQQANNSQRQQQDDGTQQQQQQQSNDTTDDTGGETSYEKLGIITARPKRLEYAVYATRFNSYNEWPRGHHMKAEDLALAGYFYTGYSDCARCFYCGGGLRNWEAQDDVWVEHARWFPKCAFLLQEVGKEFIDTVQTMSKERDQISYEDVMKRVQGSNSTAPLKFKEKVLERDPAVLSVIDNGFASESIYKLALEIRKKGEILSSDKLYASAIARHIPKKDSASNLGSDSVSIRKDGNEKRDKETIDILRTENNELRQLTTCKICMDNEVAVVFLPCGHLVSCTECSCALTQCPLCRVGIKGIVRAYVG